MAGSFNHVVNKKTGALLSNERALGMLDCYHGDVFEALEEMYGMIWWLATALSEDESPAELIEHARKEYKVGLVQSPTKRYKET